MDHWSENLQVWGVCFLLKGKVLFLGGFFSNGLWLGTKGIIKKTSCSHIHTSTGIIPWGVCDVSKGWNINIRFLGAVGEGVPKFFQHISIGSLGIWDVQKLLPLGWIVGLDVRLPERLPYSSAGYAVLPIPWNLWRIGDERVEFQVSRFVAMRNHGPCVLLGGVMRWGHEEIEISWNTGSMNNEHWCNWCFFFKIVDGNMLFIIPNSKC